MKRLGLCLLATLIFIGQAQAATLFTIGPDGDPLFPVPRQLTSLTTAGAAAAVGAPLGDGSLGFNGGLAYRSADGLLYGVANDSLGASSLVSFSTSGGALTTIAPLGFGFVGGLAYSSTADLFYAVSLDGFTGDSTLHEITPGGSATALGSVGTGFTGGLTWNADDGLLYGISADGIGVPRQFSSITPTASPTVSALFLLGDGSLGFNGGIAYDPAADLFYAISNDFLASSTLDSFTLAGGGAFSPIAGIGFGFVNVGLALVPDGNPVPEPGELALTLLGLLALALARRAPARVRQSPSAPYGSLLHPQP